MTVDKSPSGNRTQIQGNGVTNTAPVDWTFWDQNDLEVWYTDNMSEQDTLWTYGPDWVFTGGGGGPGAVEFNGARLPAGTRLTVIPAEVLNQPVDVDADNTIFGPTEEMGDRGAVQRQQLAEYQRRTPKLKKTTQTGEINFPEPVADQLIGWNADADDLENKTFVGGGEVLPATPNSYIKRNNEGTAYQSKTSPEVVADLNLKLTVNQAALTTFSAGVKVFELSGYATEGDGGQALYKRVDSEPSGDAKFRSQDRFLSSGTEDATNGGWWQLVNTQRLSLRTFGAVGDGTTDDTAAINSAMALGWPLTGEGLTYGYSGQLTLPETGIDLDGFNLKWLSATTSGARFFVYAENANNVKLTNGTIDRNGNGKNDDLVPGNASIGYMNNAATLYIKGGSGHVLDNLIVTGDDSQSMVWLSDLDKTSISIGRMKIHGANVVRENPTVSLDDNIQALRLSNCKGVNLSNIYAANLTVQVINPSDGSISSGSNELFVISGTFQAADVGKAITIAGAGAAGADLVTTIATVKDWQNITVADNAGTTVSGAVVTFTFAAIARYSRGVVLGGCEDISQSNMFVTNIAQGYDVTGSVGNKRIIINGCTADDCPENGFKLANTAVDCIVSNCIANRCGLNSFVVSGPTEAGDANDYTQNNLIHGCRAIDTGFRQPYGERTDVSGYAVLKGDVDATYPRATRIVDCGFDGAAETADYSALCTVVGSDITYDALNELVNYRAPTGGYVARESGFAFARAHVFRNAVLSIPDSTFTSVGWTSQAYDGANMNSLVSDTDVIRAPKRGLYKVEILVKWAGNATNTRRIYLQVNGSDVSTIYAFKNDTAPSAGAFDQFYTYTIALAAGDAFRIRLYQDSGVALNINSGTNMQMTYLGDAP